MKKAIVTGADGFIGSNLVEALLNLDYQVFGIQYTKEAIIKHDNYNYISCHFEEYDTLDFKDYKDGDIYHFAWQGVSGDKQKSKMIQDYNIEITRLIINKAIEYKLHKFIYAGSIFEYENEKYPSVIYDKKIDKSYSIAKYKAHQECLEIAKDKILFNSALISNIYGENENSKRFINSLVRNMKDNIPMPLSKCDQDYDFIYLKDAVRAIILIGEKGKDKEEYYVGSGNIKPLKEYVLMMKDIINPLYHLDFDKLDSKATYFDFNLFDVDKLKREFNFKCDISFEEGIKKL